MWDKRQFKLSFNDRKHSDEQVEVTQTEHEQANLIKIMIISCVKKSLNLINFKWFVCK